MRYTVEDTPEGFRLTARALDTPNTKLVCDEEGGHGPIERLYKLAQETFSDVRVAQRVRRET